MKKFSRLLELMALLNNRDTYTVEELAARLKVSRRTMLRDLHELSEMGFPLQATPGPHGGFRLIASTRLPPLILTENEAISLLMSCDTLDQYPDGPFTHDKASLLTKLRTILPPQLQEEIHHLREHVATEQALRFYRVPLAAEFLTAARQRRHIRITYLSASGVTPRLLFPYGLVASNGFWYGLCYCYARRQILWLRLDRIQSLEYATDEELPTGDSPPAISLRQILEEAPTGPDPSLKLKARLTLAGRLIGEWHPIFGKLITTTEDGGGMVDTEIPAVDIEFYGRFFLSLGRHATVEEPWELQEFLKQESTWLTAQY